ncbi:MAG: hypothetical protein K8I30_11895, partial [Anaerolineae bacterium]|nr:hypothetical protein [Anaerolineae bacterium]
MFDRIVDWITVEPTVGLLMIITVVGLFAIAFSSAREASLWPWLRRLIEAAIAAVLFLGLLWAFRSILNTNNATFYSTHGSLSNVSLASAQSIWGRPHVQRELGYAHYINVMVRKELPRDDPTKPQLYEDVMERQVVPQNSVVGFNGKVDLTLSEREKGYALYNGYLISARFEYDLVNGSDKKTECEFDFALSPGQTLYDNFSITVDGLDMSDQLRFSPDLVGWTTIFEPGQRHKVVVSYESRGMHTFYYQIPSQREIKNFQLQVSIDRLPVSLLNYPDNTLTPSQVEASADGAGSVLTWQLDKAITVAGMGIALPQPAQPGAQVLRVLSNSPYAITLLGAILALTLLIRAESVNIMNLALLVAAYSVEFLIMAAVSDYVLGFWGSLLLGAGMTGLLTWLLFRRHPSRLLRRLIYGLVAFFTLVYPLAGLLPDTTAQNSFTGLVQV